MFKATPRLIIGLVVMLVVLISIPFMVTTLDSHHIMVVQTITGKLDVYTNPGPKWIGLGSATKYTRQAQYSFCSVIDPKTGEETKCPGATSLGKRVRFSEGGHGILNGAVSWQMPLDTPSILRIQKQFGSEAAVEDMAVGKTLDSSIYFSGPMMSSTESSGTRRGELIQYIDDQAEHGIYQTQANEMVVKDPTGGNQTVSVTTILRDAKGMPLRQQPSLLQDFNITLLPLSINELKYDRIVERQIAARQESTTQVQIAIATSLKAEQQAKTAEAEGKAAAAQAKWAQEVIKATVVTKAQQDLEVAQLAAQTAQQYKLQQTLIGEGDAAKMKLEMAANGALNQKLAAYVTVNEAYAKAIAQARPGAWVPLTSMGNSQANGSSASTLVDLLTARTAKQLSLDTSIESSPSKQ